MQAIIEDLQADRSGGVPLEEIVDACQEDADLSRAKVESTVEKLLDEGEAYKPAKGSQDGVRVV